jgi:hypothetical protein
MRSLKFPRLFSGNNTQVWKESEYLNATTQNTKLLLQSMRGELLGDPYFGMLLQKYTFDQNSYLLKDMLIDMIYTQVAIFIPQLYVERSGIKIIQGHKRGEVYCQINGINQIDYQPNMFELLLFSESTI